MTLSLVALLVALSAPPPTRSPSDLVSVEVGSAPTRARLVAWRGEGARPALPGHSAAGFLQRSRWLRDGRTEITLWSALPAESDPGSGPPEVAPARWLAPDAETSWDEHIRTLASEFQEPGEDAVATSEHILIWVSLNITHADVPPHDDSAAATLSSRVGSCVGRSRLATALLRVAGVPARTVHGLIIPAGARTGDRLDSRSFRLHRWVESWLSGRGWVPSDPGESVHAVDVRHVFLALDSDTYDPQDQRDLILEVAETPAGLPAVERPWNESGHPLFVRNLHPTSTSSHAHPTP